MDPVALLLFTMLIALSVLVVYGSLRVHVPRKISAEGIEDPEIAEAYDKVNRMPQFAFLHKKFVNKLKKYNPKGTITDVGCGPGYLLKILRQAFPNNQLMGIDVSTEMIERARDNLSSDTANAHVVFRQGNAVSLPLEDSTQDFLVSTLSLHHWSNPKQALNEFYRVLKPGEQLLIFDMRRDARRALYWLISFVQNVALRVIGPGILGKINEPLGSLLASYTVEELDRIVRGTLFSEYNINGGIGWLYLWCRKPCESVGYNKM
ncbi:MAG: class I SAM-dependent methyltransferase [Candidatus Ranarchaeia archaeon]